MISKIYSAVLQGLDGELIEVEAAVHKGMRTFNIVGLADTAIKEAKERVGSAIKSAGLKPPQHQTKRVLVNLAPADLKKQGTIFDLPIALAYLLADEQVNFEPNGKLFLGELALDGQVKPIKGALCFALLAKTKGFSELILPKANAQEAALANLQGENQLIISGAETLNELIHHLEGQTMISPANQPTIGSSQPINFEIDLSWIKGQGHTKRALEIAAAGNHNLFMQGPPGTGKTLLAKAIISILPELEPQEMLELTQIYSASGLLSENENYLTRRPFRSPHHSASEPALIGGGPLSRPGEITLAHRGVLFLDEFPEFHRDVLEALRQPMEEGRITIQRAKNNLTFPARFSLLAAANPCPCGFYGNSEKECSCAPSQVASYQRKLTGPLLDRFDLFCSVGGLKYAELTSQETAELSQETAEKRANVAMARARQKERFKNEGFLSNAEMQVPHLKKYCPIDQASHQLLRLAVDNGNLSGRGMHRVLKVARTIADLRERKNIVADDVSEALSYRRKEEV